VQAGSALVFQIDGNGRFVAIRQPRNGAVHIMRKHGREKPGVLSFHIPCGKGSPRGEAVAAPVLIGQLLAEADQSTRASLA
jgi:hypothetical protein